MAYTSFFDGGTADGANFARKLTFVIDSASDVANLPTGPSTPIPGSIAYTPDFSKVYCLSNDREWVEVDLE